MLGIIKRNFSFINRDIFIKLYRSLVRPHLEYGQCIWSPYLIHCKKEIEKVQRRATKIVPGMNNLSYEERLTKLKLSSLNYRRMRGDLIQVFKLSKSKDFHLFFKCCNNATRGHNIKIEKKYNRIEIRKNCFSNRVVNKWNALTFETV